MAEITDKQYEALRLLEKHKGNLHDASRELGLRPNALTRRIGLIIERTDLDPLIPEERRKLIEMAEGERRETETAEREKKELRCSRPCRYRAGAFSVNTCDYCYITGQLRGCPPGDACTRFEEGKRANPVVDERLILIADPRPDRSEIQIYTRAQRRRWGDYRAKNPL